MACAVLKLYLESGEVHLPLLESLVKRAPFLLKTKQRTLSNTLSDISRFLVSLRVLNPNGNMEGVDICNAIIITPEAHFYFFSQGTTTTSCLTLLPKHHSLRPPT